MDVSWRYAVCGRLARIERLPRLRGLILSVLRTVFVPISALIAPVPLTRRHHDFITRDIRDGGYA